MVKLRKTVLQICLLMVTLRINHADITGIRLLGGNKPSQGHLQVRFDHSTNYQYMCGDSWTVENSKVLCRQLGYPGLVRDYRSSSGISFATGTYSETVYNAASVACQGNEYDLSSCPNNHSIVYCSIDRTVSIICHDFGYLGCFRQRPEDVGNVPNSIRFLYDITNNDECIEKCKVGYDYAGSSGPLCICTFKYPSVELDQRPDDRCSEVCASHPLQACGKNAGTEQRPFYTFYSTREGFCNDTSAPANGNITRTYNRYGDVINFRCNPGFDLIGSDSLQCLLTSANSSEISWNGTSPICFASNTVPLSEAISSTQSTMSSFSTSTVQATFRSIPSSNATLPGSNPTTFARSNPTTGSRRSEVGALDVRSIVLLAGLITISVCFIILVVVFVCCFVSRRRKRSVGDPMIELQPIQCPSPPPHPDNGPRRAVKNDYVSGNKQGDIAHVDDDGQVQHNYCSVRQQPNTTTNLSKTNKHGSTELLIDEGGDDTEYACAYECLHGAKTGSGQKEIMGTSMKEAKVFKGDPTTPRTKVQPRESNVGPESPTSLRDHEYTYIESTHPPPFLAENPDRKNRDITTAYETPMVVDATTAGRYIPSGPTSPLHHHYDPPSAHVLHEVKLPLDQKLNQETNHYLNETVIHPRSRANRDMNHN